MGKSKLVVGIVLLIIGAGLIPTGIILDRRINNELDAAIPGALLEIRESFLPAAEVMIKREAIPQAMLGLKNELTTQIPILLNGSVTAQTINGTIFTLGDTLGNNATAKDMFFNDPAWSTNTGGVFPINSISEVMGQPLGFTALSQNRTLFGNGGYPGILTDLEQGSGVFEYLFYYQQTVTPTAQNAMAAAYNATWQQLGNLTAYLSTYMFPLVPTLGSLPFPADTTYAPVYFYMQWANASLVADGISLPIRGGIDAWELGVEYISSVASSRPSNFSLALTSALWNASDPHSPFNYTDDSNDGFHYWYAASMDSAMETALRTEFGMSEDEFDLFTTDYLFNADFQDRVIVPLVEEDQGLTFEVIVLNAFYAQWSTGILIPSGIGSLGPEYSNLIGFEVVLPADNSTFALGYTRSRNMWDPANELSLINAEGIQDWLTLMRIEGENDLIKQQNIESSIQFPLMNLEFTVSRTQVAVLGEWLTRVRFSILPKLALESGLFSIHPSELANMISLVGMSVGGFVGFIGIISILAYRKR